MTLTDTQVQALQNAKVAYNGTKNDTLCVCDSGWYGVNCFGHDWSNIIYATAITAGAIAGIVIAIVVALAACGGGAYAANQYFAVDTNAQILNNPLYADSGQTRDNPLNAAH